MPWVSVGPSGLRDPGGHGPGSSPTDACLHHWHHQQSEPFLLWQCCARPDLPLVRHQAGHPGHPGTTPRGNCPPPQGPLPTMCTSVQGAEGYPHICAHDVCILTPRLVLALFCALLGRTPRKCCQCTILTSCPSSTPSPLMSRNMGSQLPSSQPVPLQARTCQMLQSGFVGTHLRGQPCGEVAGVPEYHRAFLVRSLLCNF